MASKKSPSAPAETVALFDRLIATCSEVERKGARSPYTSVNGNMFSFLHASGAVALRLPQPIRDQFLNTYSAKLFDGYGLVQKEYVTVPADLLERTDELAAYFAASFEYGKSLKPKKPSG